MITLASFSVPAEYAQIAVKTLRAARINHPIKIDGLLDDAAWAQAESGDNMQKG